jgi:hypothetical protein
VTTLRLWLQLWDVQSGRIVWESVGEATVANPILSAVQATPLDAIAQALRRHMIQDELASRESKRARAVVDVVLSENSAQGSGRTAVVPQESTQSFMAPDAGGNAPARWPRTAGC